MKSNLNSGVKKSRTIIGAIIATISLMTVPANAKDSIFNITGEQASSHIDLGAAYISRPTYRGSNTQDYRLLPYIAGQYKGRLFIDPSRGAGVHAIHKKKFQLSAYAALASSREAQDTGLYKGAARTKAGKDALEIDTPFLAATAARWRFKYGLAEINAAIPVTGDVDGVRSEWTLTSKIPFEPIGLKLYPGARATYQSGGWNQSYYGLNKSQAAATGQSRFDADKADISVLGTFLLGQWDIPNSEARLIGLINYNWLQGRVKSSPLTPKNGGLTTVVGIAKHF